MVLKMGRRTSKPKRVGAAEWHEEKLVFFVTYTKCEHCRMDYKIQMPLDEARQFAKAIGLPESTFKERIAGKVQKWAHSDKL